MERPQIVLRDARSDDVPLPGFPRMEPVDQASNSIDATYDGSSPLTRSDDSACSRWRSISSGENAG